MNKKGEVQIQSKYNCIGQDPKVPRGGTPVATQLQQHPTVSDEENLNS